MRARSAVARCATRFAPTCRLPARQCLCEYQRRRELCRRFYSEEVAHCAFPEGRVIATSIELNRIQAAARRGNTQFGRAKWQV